MLAILNSFEQKKRKVIGIDIDLRKHNKDILNKHFLKKKMTVQKPAEARDVRDSSSG